MGAQRSDRDRGMGLLGGPSWLRLTKTLAVHRSEEQTVQETCWAEWPWIWVGECTLFGVTEASRGWTVESRVQGEGNP